MNTPLIVKDLRKETDEYFSIVFEKPDKFSFLAGDCVDLSFPDRQELGKKTFSFASSPTEEDILITYKKGFSEYKKKMDKIKVGEEMISTQYGSNFVFQPKYESVFFAGGVGIAPFRSMIKLIIDEKIPTQVTLIYLNRLPHFPFKDELDLWRDSVSFLKVHYLATETKGRLTKKRIQALIPQLSQPNLMNYIVGPPGMVDATEEILEELDIEKKRIQTDSFDGYFEEA